MGSLDAIVRRARELGGLAERRLQLRPRDTAAAERARQLRDHALGYVAPRAADLDAPLVIVVLGPTGSGKSSLLNAIAGAPVSATGVLRPTTRSAILFATTADADRLTRSGQLSRLPAQSLARVVAPMDREGLAVVDAPDIDSVELENRQLADILLESADLCVFVTTASRYADLVPHEVLARVRERGLPVVLVLNRLPADSRDREIVVADATRLLAQAGLSVDGAMALVREGERDQQRDALSREALRPLLERVDELSRDREARIAAAAAALDGALRGLAPLAETVADDIEHEAIDAEALRRVAAATYAGEARTLGVTLHEGAVLRDEILRQWHDFVGADQITRFVAKGLSRIQAMIATALHGERASPLPDVEREAVAAVEALVLRHANEAARQTASRWSERADGQAALARDPALWSASNDLAAAVRAELDAWLRSIVDDVRAAGAQKKTTAQITALGVNVVGVAVMLAVFAHTAGLTGAELGIAGGAAFVNQKLLEAIFGERVMAELVDRAGDRLDAAIETLFAHERERFEREIPAPQELRDLAASLRETAGTVAR